MAPGVEQELRQIEAELDEARVQGNMSVFEAVLGPGFRTTSPVGTVSDRDQSLRDFATRTMHVSRSHSKDITVREFGDVAIITGIAAMTARVRGYDITGEYAYTHIYVRNDGRWQVVAAHSSRRMPDWLFLVLVKMSNLFRL
jgi:hypothetical protein